MPVELGFDRRQLKGRITAIDRRDHAEKRGCQNGRL
jgi:hypothetical protein